MGDEHENQSVIAVKLDRLIKDVEELSRTMKEMAESNTAMAVWRANIEARLTAGVERMNALQSQLDEKVDKRLVYAAVVGAGLGGAGLVKVLTALMSH